MWVYAQDDDGVTKDKNEEINECTVQEKETIWRRPLFRQILATLGPLALIFSAGIGLGTATVMIPQLRRVNSTIRLDAEIETWLYSAHGFAAVPVSAVIPYVTQSKGYKLPFLFVCFPSITAFLLQYFAINGVQLLIATILQGMTMGGNVSLTIIILSELTGPKYRGAFLIFKSATFFWGIWIANAIGTYSSWRNIPLFGIWSSIFALASYFIWPESPYWLASKGRIEECEKSFRWLRGRSQVAENELTSLTKTMSTTRNNRSKRSRRAVLEIVRSRQFYMPIILNMLMFFISHSCGKIVCQTYVLVIIKDIAESDSLAYTGMLILDGVSVFGMYLGSYVAMKVNRRLMYFSTTLCTILFLYLLSMYLYLVQFKFVVGSNTISLCLLILYTFSVSWGPMVLCTSIYAEITPMRYKPFITSVCVSFMFIWHSVYLKLAPLIFKTVGINGSFAVYGTLILFPFLILWKFLPETKNRTLNEIESCFMKKNYFVRTSSNNENEEMLRKKNKINEAL